MGFFRRLFSKRKGTAQTERMVEPGSNGDSPSLPSNAERIVEIDGALLLYAVKAGSLPTQDEIREMLAAVFGGTGEGKYAIVPSTFEAAAEKCTLAASVGFPFPNGPERADRLTAASAFALVHAVARIRASGTDSEGRGIGPRVLYYSNDMTAPDARALLGAVWSPDSAVS